MNSPDILPMDENWPRRMTRKRCIAHLKKYYRHARKVYPSIPPRISFQFKSRIGALADVRRSDKQVWMRFDAKIDCHKLVVRQFLHEMVHVIWPRLKHGMRFESRIFRLRRQLFDKNMVIY